MTLDFTTSNGEVFSYEHFRERRLKERDRKVALKPSGEQDDGFMALEARFIKAYLISIGLGKHTSELNPVDLQRVLKLIQDNSTALRVLAREENEVVDEFVELTTEAEKEPREELRRILLAGLRKKFNRLWLQIKLECFEQANQKFLLTVAEYSTSPKGFQIDEAQTRRIESILRSLFKEKPTRLDGLVLGDLKAMRAAAERILRANSLANPQDIDISPFSSKKQAKEPAVPPLGGAIIKSLKTFLSETQAQVEGDGKNIVPIQDYEQPRMAIPKNEEVPMKSIQAVA